MQVLYNEVGASRSDGKRICFVASLSAVFRIDEHEATVTILSIRPIRRSSGSNGNGRH